MKAIWDSFLTMIAEAIGLIEGIHVDEFNTQLRALTNSEHQREEIRQGALLIAKLGYSPEDVERALIAYAKTWRGEA